MKINRNGCMNPDSLIWDTFAELVDFDKKKDTLVFLRHQNGKLEIACEKGK